MKKMYTLLFALSIIVCSVYAQQSTPENLNRQSLTAPKSTNTIFGFKEKNVERSATSRWYNYGEAADAMLGGGVGNGPSELRGNFLFPDSTILVNYSSGPGATWVHNLADVLDVKSTLFNDPTIYPGELNLTASDPYRLDSIGVWFLYDRNLSSSIIDTLVIEYNYVSTTQYSYFMSGVASNLGTDTVMFRSINYDYPSNTLSLAGKQTIKVPLTPQVFADSTADGFHYVEVSTNKMQIPAGAQIYTSVSFIPGYTWSANSDFLADMNNVFFLSYKENPGNFPMYTKRDWNCSYIAPISVRYNNAGGWNGRFIPSFAYMGTAPTYNYEHHLFYYKISTPTSGIQEQLLTNDMLSQNMPNPASNNTLIKYELKESANVSLKVFDLTGKEVLTINEGSKMAGIYTVNLNTEALQNGIYFYTLQAGNESATRKMTIVK
jgi:hypothetical protein